MGARVDRIIAANQRVDHALDWLSRLSVTDPRFGGSLADYQAALVERARVEGRRIPAFMDRDAAVQASIDAERDEHRAVFDAHATIEEIVRLVLRPADPVLDATMAEAGARK